MEFERGLVSIISINYNSLNYTLQMIKSLDLSTYKNIEIVLVDNGSTDDPADALSPIDKVTYVRSDKNLGFAGGNNIGIKYSKGEYLFFVNNDTEFTPTLIQDLLNTLHSNVKVGLVSPKIIYYGTQTIQFAGYTEISNLTGRNKALGNKKEDSPDYQNLINSPYAHGAAMMTTRSVVEKCGRMPEIYFLYYEELDWCEKIRSAGYEILVNRSTYIFHKESMSVGKNSPLKTYYLTRNRLLFFRRNKRKLERMVFYLYFYLLVFPIKSITGTFKGEWQHLKSFWKGVFWHFTNSPNG
ncbi:MAG: glycosyltransferase family 2 protein [Bacteroidota bacterium]